MADDPVASVPVSIPGRPPSLVAWIAVMVGLSLVAVAVGAGLGIELAGTTKSNVQEDAAPSAPQQDFASTSLVDLPPVITNLADPADAWVRLQASIVVDNATMMKPEVLAAEISDDILGFMKTVTLAQIGGASGLQHLREDLTERAAIRSQGHVHEFIIQTLVVQ